MIERTLRRVSKNVFGVSDKLTSPPEGPRILIYHQVGADLGREMEVTVDDFTFHLDWLEQNAQVTSLGDAIERWRDPDARRLVALTFDDGYEDTFTRAFPLLHERGMPFTLYVSTRQVEEAGMEQEGAKPIGWDAINTMNGSGLLTIGAHTHTHCDLRHATKPQIEDELDLSNRLIEERTGVRPSHFAYPWGYWSSTAHDLVVSRYESAVLGGSPRTRRELDRHRISRFPVQRSDGSTFFEQRLIGGFLLEERVRRLLRGYRGP